VILAFELTSANADAQDAGDKGYVRADLVERLRGYG